MEVNKFALKTPQGEILCHNTIVAQKTTDRMKGLMFSTELPECDGFLIKRCNSIHTFFMLYSLDVIFLDREFRVVKIIEEIKPWRMTWFYLRATQTLELKGGYLKSQIKCNLKVGDQLEALCTN